MKNNEINVTKVLTAGIMTASLIPFITYFQSSENSPQANSEKNDEVNSADSPVSFYAGFQSQNPVFQGGKFLNSDNSHYLTTSAFADLNLGLRIIDATTFSTAFDGTHPDDPYIDVPLDTLINTLNCIDNDIDLGFVPRANNDIMLNYVYSDWFDYYQRWSNEEVDPSNSSVISWLFQQLMVDYYETKHVGINEPDEVNISTGSMARYLPTSYGTIGASTNSSFSIITTPDPLLTYNIAMLPDVNVSNQYNGQIEIFWTSISCSLVPVSSGVEANWNNMIKIRKLSDDKYYAYLQYDSNLDITISFQIQGSTNDKQPSSRYDASWTDNDTFSSTISLSDYLRQ